MTTSRIIISLCFCLYCVKWATKKLIMRSELTDKIGENVVKKFRMWVIAYESLIWCFVSKPLSDKFYLAINVRGRQSYCQVRIQWLSSQVAVNLHAGLVKQSQVSLSSKFLYRQSCGNKKTRKNVKRLQLISTSTTNLQRNKTAA